MRVIGIDPGYERLGVAVLERVGGSESYVYSACIETPRAETLPKRLAAIGAELASIIETHKPERLGIETLYFNKNQKTAIAVAEARGVVLLIAENHGLPVDEYTPQEVKVSVTGYGKSSKDDVAMMLHRLLPNLPKIRHDDEYDAVAVGLTTLVSTRLST